MVRAAFSRGGQHGDEEVAAVRRTWALTAAPDGFDLVAVEDGAVVGHVMAAIGHLDGHPLPGIAPLAVRPDRQRRGIGTALMTDVLRRIDAAGWPAALLLGNPDYYRRFGFVSAETIGIVYPPVRGPDFLVRRFDPKEPLPEGAFRYAWEDPSSIG
jgi:putative acetyltransferase